jgi:nucleoside-diphosphate kinase
MERSLVFIKPDGVERGLVGAVLQRFEKRNIKVTALKMLQLDEALVEKHYAEHIERPFFPALKEYVLSGPIVVMVLEADHVVSIIRTMVGATNAAVAEPGTIRGDYALSTSHNIIHASDSPENAEREIANFF